MLRYWRIYTVFFRTSFAREIEFRANFVAKVIQNAAWIGFHVLIVEVLYRNTESIAGWSKGEVYVLAGTCFLISGLVYISVGASLIEMPDKVRRGTLDFDLLKPIDPQFTVSVRRFNFDEIGTAIVGLLIVLVAAISSTESLDPAGVLSYIGLGAAAALIYYSILLALMTTSIWFVRVDNMWVLGESVFTFARFPIDIYAASLQRLLTFYFPLALIAAIPARALFDGAAGSTWALAGAWAAASLLASRWFLRFACSRYTSASS